MRQLQTGVSHIHSRGILIVDLNEMNFLVAPDFSELFFIDVDSYQTPSFPATVLMESVRDRHAKAFSSDSDWFSFAVVSFQMFVGIHRSRERIRLFNTCLTTRRNSTRACSANVSVLHPGVSVPAACLPFSVIPPNYLDWYRAVFEQGKRLPPPQAVQAVIAVAGPPVGHSIASRRFEVREVREFDSEIIWHDGVITATEQKRLFQRAEIRASAV